MQALGDREKGETEKETSEDADFQIDLAQHVRMFVSWSMTLCRK